MLYHYFSIFKWKQVSPVSFWILPSPYLPASQLSCLTVFRSLYPGLAEALEFGDSSVLRSSAPFQPSVSPDGHVPCRTCSELQVSQSTNEPPHDKTNKMTCPPSKDSDQNGHPPSLIRVFAVCMKKPWILSYPLSAQRRLIRLGRCPGWSESSLCAQSFCLFCHEAAQIHTSHAMRKSVFEDLWPDKT